MFVHIVHVLRIRRFPYLFLILYFVICFHHTSLCNGSFWVSWCLFFFFSYIKYKLSKKVASKIHIAKKKTPNITKNKTKQNFRTVCVYGVYKYYTWKHLIHSPHALLLSTLEVYRSVSKNRTQFIGWASSRTPLRINTSQHQCMDISRTLNVAIVAS